jgi:sigma-B regulation protein RsbU (phosphoserine phosphatase)
MIRALIADDEAPARDRLRHLLSAADVEVVGEAEDGEHAVEQIDALAPDLVFLDIQMPALSGLEVAARLRAPRPRIVFCTAYDQFAVDAFEHHAVDYLLKPVSRERLARTVERVGRQIHEQRRRTAERDEAVRTQARLMPSGSAPTPGFECAGACRPAEGVGGDYYDFIDLGSGRLAVSVGDVSGKGMYAGLLAAAVQARVQAVTASGVHGPAAVLSEINRLTVGTIDAHRYVTVFFSIFDRAAFTLTYASAGHLPGLLCGTAGATTLLESTGPAIGWSADAIFEQRTLPLGDGDLFAAYSDGLTDTLDASGQELGVEGLASLVRGRRSHAAPDIVTGVLAAIDRYAAGAPAADDRTLIVARRGRAS